MLTLRAGNAPAIQRLHPSDDALLSPFLLSATSVKPCAKATRRRHRAMWLHTPVMVRSLTLTSAHLATISRLRHPNLEQFLGAVMRDPLPSIVTAAVQATSLRDLPAHHLTPRIAIAAVLDAARALVYLHATTQSPHAAVRPAAILYDRVRERGVLLLPLRKPAHSPFVAPDPPARGKHALAVDVYALAAVLVNTFLTMRRLHDKPSSHHVRLLPRCLQSVVRNALHRDPAERPSIRRLCRALDECHQSLSS